jgi:hypothetical protein
MLASPNLILTGSHLLCALAITATQQCTSCLANPYSIRGFTIVCLAAISTIFGMVFGVSIELWADQGAKAFWAPRELARPLTLWVSLGASLFELMGLKVQRVENKRVDEFANMSDEELEAYVNGDRGLEH